PLRESLHRGRGHLLTWLFTSCSICACIACSRLIFIERFEIFRIDIDIGEIKGDFLFSRVHPSDPVRPVVFNRVLFTFARLERAAPTVFRKYAVENSRFGIDIEGRAAADRKVGTEHTRKNSADCYRIRGEIATVNKVSSRYRLFSNVPRRDVILTVRQNLYRSVFLQAREYASFNDFFHEYQIAAGIVHHFHSVYPPSRNRVTSSRTNCTLRNIQCQYVCEEKVRFRVNFVYTCRRRRDADDAKAKL